MLLTISTVYDLRQTSGICCTKTRPASKRKSCHLEKFTSFIRSRVRPCARLLCWLRSILWLSFEEEARLARAASWTSM